MPRGAQLLPAGTVAQSVTALRSTLTFPVLLVSKTPGEKSGAVGIVTLEDVVEEMIGEEVRDSLVTDADRADRRRVRPIR